MFVCSCWWCLCRSELGQRCRKIKNELADDGGGLTTTIVFTTALFDGRICSTMGGVWWWCEAAATTHIIIYISNSHLHSQFTFTLQLTLPFTFTLPFTLGFNLKLFACCLLIVWFCSLAVRLLFASVWFRFGSCLVSVWFLLPQPLTLNLKNGTKKESRPYCPLSPTTLSKPMVQAIYFPKYLLSRPSNALPCLASSFAISCTVS